MKRILHPSLTLGARKPFLSQRESTLARLDMVLHSRVGDIPWRPDFGCDVTGLIGEPATPSKIQETSSLVERTIHKWLPDVMVNDCEIQLIHAGGVANTHREAGIPVAESALVAMGTESNLELRLDLEVENEVLEIGTDFDILPD
jgi:phage baseplate assembly protein W